MAVFFYGSRTDDWRAVNVEKIIGLMEGKVKKYGSLDGPLRLQATPEHFFLSVCERRLRRSPSKTVVMQSRRYTPCRYSYACLPEGEGIKTAVARRTDACFRASTHDMLILPLAVRA